MVGRRSGGGKWNWEGMVRYGGEGGRGRTAFCLQALFGKEKFFLCTKVCSYKSFVPRPIPEYVVSNVLLLLLMSCISAGPLGPPGCEA